jgi:alpha-tubulin suppressor-like RCC1 family protein
VKVRRVNRVSTVVAAWLSSAALASAAACADDRRDDAPEATLGPDAAPTTDARAPLEDGASPPDASADVVHAYDAAPEPVACGVSPCAVALAAGKSHVCALLADGTIRCWGDDTKGALGRGAGDSGPRDAGVGPAEVVAVRDAVQISAADEVTCARLADGGVVCWGANDKGQLGLSAPSPVFDDEAHPTPTLVALSGPALRVDVGHGSSCAQLESGEITCWGANEQHQLLRPDAGIVGAPAVADLRGARFVRTAFGDVTGYAITDERDFVSWGVVSGRNTSLSLDPEPYALPTLANLVDVAAGPVRVGYEGTTFHTCVVASGRVYCWGKTDTEEIPALCNGVPNDQRVPVAAPVSGSGLPQQIAVGRTTTCVRLTDGTIECCGDDAQGQLGRGEASANRAVLSFGRASALDGHAVQVVTGDTMTCALLREGRVLCWGGNRRGELGQGNVDPQAHPTPVAVSL